MGDCVVLSNKFPSGDFSFLTFLCMVDKEKFFKKLIQNYYSSNLSLILPIKLNIPDIKFCKPYILLYPPWEIICNKTSKLRRAKGFTLFE